MNALEQCFARKMTRFVVYDDGKVFLQRQVTCAQQAVGDSGNERLDIDASPYLSAVAGMKEFEEKMVDELVPDALRDDWRLGVHRENGWSVWTPFHRHPPSLASLGFAMPSGN